MFREFNVKFEDVEMLGGADNLLEGTEITKVIVRGDNNKMSSLDSMLKNCNELDTVDGELDLKGVSDIDNLLEGTELVKSIDLKNINNENISANNSFPHIEEINIGGEVYDKKAMQNVIASKDWTFDNITYSGTVGDNVVTKEVNIIDDNKVTIQDTLEQKTKGIEIIGQTYENLVVGNGEATLLDELTLESIDGNSKEFNPHLEQPVCVEAIEGETYQNLIDGKGEYKLTDTFSTTWTESNNIIENPPSMIEIPEIWGNTVQGYANIVTAKMIVDSINNSGIGCTATLKSDKKTLVVSDAFPSNPPSSSDNFMQLKANTTYTLRCYRLNTTQVVNVATYHGNNPTVANVITQGNSFTTDSSGKVLFYPHVVQDGTLYFRCVEGQVNLSQYDYDEMDLNYIQSVGDLYVDESGEPILDEEGNEQYKLEIDCSNDLICDFTKYEYSPKRLWNGILENHIVKSANVLKNEVQFQMNGNIQGVSILGVKANVLGVYTIRFKYNSSDYSPFIRMNSMKKGVFVEQPTTTIKTDEEGYRYAEFSLSKEFDELRFTLGIETCFDASFTHSFSDVVIYLGTGLKIIPQSNKTTILMPQPLRKIKYATWGKEYLLEDKLRYENGKYILDRASELHYLKPYLNNLGNSIGAGNVGFKRYALNVALEGHLVEDIDSLISLQNSTNYKGIPLLKGWDNPVGNVYWETKRCYSFNCVSNNGSLEYSFQFLLEDSLTREDLLAMLDDSYFIIGNYKDAFRNDENRAEVPYFETVETKILEKPSLETYSPKTYITTNTEIQPSQMTITNKRNLIDLRKIKSNTDYTLQLKCNEKGNKPIKINLCGKEKDIDATIGVNHVNITTNELNDNKLELSGEGNIVSEIIVVEGEMNQYPEYFNGVQSTGELQDDGTYKIDITTENEFKNINLWDGKKVSDYATDFIEIYDNTFSLNSYDAYITEYDADRQLVTREYITSTANKVLTAKNSNCKYITVRSNIFKETDTHYVKEGLLVLSNRMVSFKEKPTGFRNSLKVLISSNSPLAKGDKLYWNKSNKRYEIDRNGVIEVPVVEGDVIDLPRLYQRDGTNINISTGNIKPAKTKIVYKDII